MTMAKIESLIDLLNAKGGSASFGEPVSILEHSLQAAHSRPTIFLCSRLHHASTLSSRHFASAKTTEVSIWRSGMLQYCLRRRSFSFLETI
jgi:hypothetical protein